MPLNHILIHKVPSVFQVARGGGPRVVLSTAAFHARVRGSIPGFGGLKETKMFPSRVKLSIVESLRDREVACSASDRQGSNFESCVWRTLKYLRRHKSILRRRPRVILGNTCSASYVYLLHSIIILLTLSSSSSQNIGFWSLQILCDVYNQYKCFVEVIYRL